MQLLSRVIIVQLNLLTVILKKVVVDTGSLGSSDSLGSPGSPGSPGTDSPDLNSKISPP